MKFASDELASRVKRAAERPQERLGAGPGPSMTGCASGVRKPLYGGLAASCAFETEKPLCDGLTAYCATRKEGRKNLIAGGLAPPCGRCG